jgi:hypothetical protein
MAGKQKPGVETRLFCAQSTYNAFFSTGRRGIRGALIAQGRRQSAKNQPIIHQAVEI